MDNYNYEDLYDDFMKNRCKCMDDDDDCMKNKSNCRDDDDMNKCGCKGTRMCKNHCSSTVFAPVCCNAVCNVPRMDNITIVAEGHGTINGDEEEVVVQCPGKGKGCGGNNGGGEEGEGGEGGESSTIAFKFSIGKKFSKYVGTLCLVNYDDEIFISSDKLECYHNPDHTKFVAIFHVETENGTREVAVFATTKICANLPTLFIYSAPQCGLDDEIAMGGSVTTGTITIEKKDDKESSMGH